MKNAFGNVFLKQLMTERLDDPEISLDSEIPDETNPEQEAMLSTLDPGTDPAQFDSSEHSKQALKAASQAQVAMVNELKGWIDKMSEMVSFLNGTDASSIQTRLRNAIPDTIFDKIASSETKKIARVAMEVASLCEALKGYLATSANPKFKFV